MIEDERAVYDRLWAEAQSSFQHGDVDVDPHLSHREADTRRGLTLAARFAPAAQRRLAGVLEDLHALAPEQHIYRPDELHLTILSVITTTAGFEAGHAPVKSYRALFADVFAAVAPFTLDLRGLTASRCCVLLCGYSPDGALNALRDLLREAVAGANLGANLERRYRSTAAHTTLLRFQAPPARLDVLREYVAARRDTDYGSYRVDCVDFVLNDWYMSHDRVRLLARYPLGGPAPE